MPLPALLGAGLIAGGASLAGNIIGGIINSNSQKRTNEINASLTRETNWLNYMQNEQNLQAQNAWFQSALRYNSPSDQREMFEAAGYSPYAYLTHGGSSASTPSTPSAIPMSAPQYMPNNFLGEGIGQGISQLGSSALSGMLTMAQSRKTGLEADHQQLENSVFSDRFSASMESLHLGNEYQRIKNRYADAKESVTLETLKANKELTDKQIEQIQLANDIQAFYKDKMQPVELDKLLSEVSLNAQRGMTEISLRQYYRAMGRSAESQAAASMIQARIARYLSTYQARELASRSLNNEQQAELNKRVAAGQLQQNVLTAMYGARLKKAELDKMVSGNKLNYAQCEKIYKENEYLQQQITFYEWQQASENLIQWGLFAPMFGLDYSGN